MMNRLTMCAVVAAVLLSACGHSPAEPTAPSCVADNTAAINYQNQSASPIDVYFDTHFVSALAAYQKSQTFNVEAGVEHTILLIWYSPYTSWDVTTRTFEQCGTYTIYSPNPWWS